MTQVSDELLRIEPGIVFVEERTNFKSPPNTAENDNVLLAHFSDV